MTRKNEAQKSQIVSRRAFLKTAVLGATGLVIGRHWVPRRAVTNRRWAASTDLNITIYSTSEPAQRLTYSHNDFKPSWSPDGSMLTFFRATRYGADFKDWRSMICVINADGTGFRELTSAEYPNFNPTWTRDGSNRIIFNRFSLHGDSRNQVYWITPTASKGDEELISDPDFLYFEWANSGLRDGRIFVDRQAGAGFQSFLLTPDQGVYEEIERPTRLPWHKLSVSPSETKVAYMLDKDNNIPTYNDSVICFAEFDIEALRIHTPVQITTDELTYIQEYPAWNENESLIVYDSNESGTYQVYAYQIADGTTIRLSSNENLSDQFADFEGLPK
ncbi:MAG: PD40 domain-containing protein [Chloroflexi bacterium]|nr:PD40 domain-containing protein [Chloroflexota bacterium]